MGHVAGKLRLQPYVALGKPPPPTNATCLAHMESSEGSVLWFGGCDRSQTWEILGENDFAFWQGCQGPVSASATPGGALLEESKGEKGKGVQAASGWCHHIALPISTGWWRGICAVSIFLVVSLLLLWSVHALYGHDDSTTEAIYQSPAN
jgi:hypothetical protein